MHSITNSLICAVCATFLLAGVIADAEVSISTSSLGGIYAPGDMIWQDEFDRLDSNVWQNEIDINGGGNNEFQIYDRNNTNAYVRSGILYIRPSLTLHRYGGDFDYLYNGLLQLEGCTHDNAPSGSGCRRQARHPNILQPVMSARLRTKGSFSFKYGRVEVKARMPAGDWTWPAIWLLPEDKKYGGWPASGKIDMCESRGNRKLFNLSGVNIGSERVGSTLHFGPFWPHNGYWAAHNTRNSAADAGYDRDFHLYQMEWTPTQLKFSLDGTELKTVTPPAGGFFELGRFPSDVANPWTGADNFRMAPFDQNFHFILNVAVGGNYFPSDSTGPYPRPWLPGSSQTFLDFFSKRLDWSPSWQNENAALAVDYIRVWAV